MSATTTPTYSFSCLIGGDEVGGVRTLPVHYPFTGEVVGEEIGRAHV